MDELERELKAALGRVPAPPGFAGRVLAKVNHAPAAVSWWRRGPALRWAAVGLVAVVAFTGAMAAYRDYERARGERARAQVILALRITGSTLHSVQAQLQRMGPQGGEE